MANTLISNSRVIPPVVKGADNTPPDARVWKYKGKEAKLFESLEAVPEGEGWQDAPYDEAAPAPPTEPQGVAAIQAEPVGEPVQPEPEATIATVTAELKKKKAKKIDVDGDGN